MHSDIKCLFSLLHYYRIFRGIPVFSVLEDLDVVQKLKWVYEARNVTPGRLYHIFLLVQQILKFQSKVREITQTTIPSWGFVDETRSRADKHELRRRKTRSLLPPTFHILTEREYETLRKRCTCWLTRAMASSE